MEDSYRTLKDPAEGFFRDRNSRFLAFAFPVESIMEINEIIASLRKKYHDARHHCYAYRINPEREQIRMNDDGEPSGTAGKPIYNQLVSNDLMNSLIVVVRYFGGTLLGTGGLINAYKSASLDAINKASIVIRYIEILYRLIFTYEKLGAVMKVLKDEGVNTLNAKYDNECSIIIKVRKNASAHLLEKFVSIGDIRAELMHSD